MANPPVHVKVTTPAVVDEAVATGVPNAVIGAIVAMLVEVDVIVPPTLSVATIVIPVVIDAIGVNVAVVVFVPADGLLNVVLKVGVAPDGFDNEY